MPDTKASPPSTQRRVAQAGGEEPRQYSPATVRKAIIQILATTGAHTAREIEAAVGELLPSAELASVSQQLATLSEGEYVVGESSSQGGRLTLSESGQRWWTGIEALTPRTT